MAKLLTLFAAAGIAAAAALAQAKAEDRSVSCQGINGQTICLSTSRGSGISLACQSINGKTICLGSGGLHCQTDARGRLACRGGDGSTRVEIYGPNAGNGGSTDDDDDDE
jgi:hypothetical protein